MIPIQILAKKAMELVTHVVPGPPFVFGSLLVILALMVAAFIPEGIHVMSKLGGGSGGAFCFEVCQSKPSSFFDN